MRESCGAWIGAERARPAADPADEFGALVRDEPGIQSGADRRCRVTVDRDAYVAACVAEAYEETGRRVARGAHRADAEEREFELLR